MCEGYVKPCIRENNPEYVILHVETNELNSELTLFKPTIELSVYPV